MDERSTPHLHPDERIRTFRGRFRNAYAGDAGLRIDHGPLSSEVATRLSKAEVDKHVRGWEQTSDHASIRIVVLGEPPKKRKAKRSRLEGRRIKVECLVPPARQTSIRLMIRSVHATK